MISKITALISSQEGRETLAKEMASPKRCGGLDYLTLKDGIKTSAYWWQGKYWYPESFQGDAHEIPFELLMESDQQRIINVRS